MTVTNVGDLGQSLSMRRHNAALQKEFQNLTEEVATGKHHDLTEAVDGGFRPIAGLETSLSRLDSYESASEQAVLLTDGLQTVLERVNTLSGEIAPRLLSGANSGSTEQLSASSQAAKAEFESVVSALNTQVSGRTLLAGEAIDTKPLSPADEILAGAQAEIAGLTTAADITAALDAWFAPGGGFEIDHYKGSTEPASPLTIGEGVSIEEPLTALDDDIKDTLKGFIMATVVSENGNALASNERAELAANAAETLMGANAGLVDEQGRVGTNQGQLENRLTEIGSERHAVELAHNAITSVDSYELRLTHRRSIGNGRLRYPLRRWGRHWLPDVSLGF